MKKSRPFVRLCLGLSCLLTIATFGCGDSQRGTSPKADGGDALDGHGDTKNTATRDAARAERGLASDSELADHVALLDANGPDQERDVPGEDTGEPVAADASLSVDANEETEDVDGAAPADIASSLADGPPVFVPADAGPDAPLGTEDSEDALVAFDTIVVDAPVSGSVDGPGVDGRGASPDAATINTDAWLALDTAVPVDSPVSLDGAADGGDLDATDALDVNLTPDASNGPEGDGGADGEGGSSYVVQGEYLVNPDLAKGMLKSLADFRVRARDTVNGGSFTYAKVDGTVSSDHRKSFVTQTRDAWTFARAFMVTGDETYLTYAAQETDFLTAHGWDATNGGWYFISDELGNTTSLWPGYNPNTFKGCFIQHYALLGIGALCDATREADTCAWLQKGRSFLDGQMWDSRSSLLGYYDYGSLDLTTVRSKSFTSTVDALTTHAIQTSLLWPSQQEIQQRLLDLANIVADRLAANLDLPGAKFGFPENYDTDWNVETSQTTGYVGHVLKSAWVLARTYLRHPDVRYREAARKLIYDVLNNGGWNEEHGVPYTTTNWSTGAQNTTQTECWQIQQAIMSGLSNWYIADNQADKDVYLRMADRALSFFAAYVVDHVDGGTWKMNNIDGTPKGSSKANEYNVEYHSTETFYFTYLYGNLMLHRRPVTLYYRVSPKPDQQVIQLNPVAIDDASLWIQSMTLDGTPFTGFSGQTREVTLAANQGGKLAVTFGAAP